MLVVVLLKSGDVEMTCPECDAYRITLSQQDIGRGIDITCEGCSHTFKNPVGIIPVHVTTESEDIKDEENWTVVEDDPKWEELF